MSQPLAKAMATTTKLVVIFLGLFASFSLFAHGVDEGTRQFLAANQGVSILPFIYIGAKHMVTGYDHLLFLVGVIFFLYRTKDVLLYVSLFTIGHSITLLYGVFYDIQVNAYLIDAIIGFSIVYKGFDNLGGFKRMFGFQPNTKVAVMIFGLFHGFGLATKIQEFNLPQEGLLANIIGFNVGVEIGQFLALGVVLIVMSFWRRHQSYLKFATTANTLLMSGGLMLVGYQLTGYFTS
ncbi:HupE/UreJ family protein [Shewanella sp. KX20019]|uniref:HupE/UreJ family protein n=1 Tax=Shewanella sp. KX20019 TaxID=2803864 RepID=UPI0019261418|nr:HupE/UreJ family protein [Shewanella sp. KX20019]QQX80067.1 HupE/UreJ family protein [Shewanella sp. KX20019]